MYPKELYGQFYQGDSYIVLYRYKKPSSKKEAAIIYFWQGRDSSTDEKGASALLTVDLDNQLQKEGLEPVQVRVVQGREPNHFLTLFKGRMIVHQGGVPSAFNNRKETTNVNESGIAFYHIHGTTALNTRAIQVKEVAASLNSGDCFALLTPSIAYVWCGKGANNEEKQVAMNVTKIITGNRKTSQVEEGAEVAAFWDALGGKTEYATSKILEQGSYEARLFHCSTVLGSFKITEIPNFVQEDLINDDVMILDTFTEVFVWLGHDSTKEERDAAMQTALDYVKNAPDGRPADTPVYRVTSSNEPPNFTCHFYGWDDKKANDFDDPYLKSLQKLGGAKGGGKAEAHPEKKGGGLERVTANDIGFLDPATKKFPLAEIQAGSVANINPACKEAYLSDDDFKKIFKVSRDEFEAQPKWKKEQQKKANKLF